MAFSNPVRNSDGSTESPKTLIVPFASFCHIGDIKHTKPKLGNIPDFLSRCAYVRKDLIGSRASGTATFSPSFVARNAMDSWLHGDWVGDSR